jgi:uncharacterized protein DUF2752
MRNIPATSAEPLSTIHDDVSWIEDGPEQSRRRRITWLQERHRTMLVLSIFVIVMSLALELRPSGHVAVSWLSIDALPPLCGSRTLFGVECPGCGLTRSFVALASGDIRESFRLHRVGWLLAVAVVLQIPYRIYALRELRTSIPERKWPTWFGNLLIAALIINWLAKMLSA